MRGIVFREGRKVALETLADPVPGPDEAVIRIRASGICHTDFEVLKGNYGASAFPLVPGHEFAGEIIALGENVRGLELGQRVVADPNLGCGACPACARGEVNLCPKLGAYGVSCNGGFAEACVLRAAALLPAGDMPWEVAALAEPLGCILNGLSPLHGRVINRALVIGGGPIGMLMCLALKWRGVAEVTVIDRNEHRLVLARSLGFTALLSGSPEIEALQRSQDMVVDATGAIDVVQGLIDKVIDGGAALYFGVCPQDGRITLSPFKIFRRQLSLFGTHSLNRGNITQAIALLGKHGAEAAKVVSHRLNLEEIEAVFQNGNPPGSMKVQLLL